MIKVLVTKKNNYPVSVFKIKKALSKFFLKQGITSDAEVNVTIVNESEMLRIGRKYLSPKEPLHNVLSFVSGESKTRFINPPDNVLRLGDIVICFPVAVKEAFEEGVTVEEKVIELLKHGGYHLLGKHHD